jgi:hypothetical protein
MEALSVPNPCRFTLDNGQPCGNHALRSSHFCRHHDHLALQRRGPRTRPLDLDTPEQRAQRSLNWRSLHEQIPSADDDHLSDASATLMAALGDRKISHRSAGRLFEAIEDRRRVLEFQTLSRDLLETAERIQEGFARSTGAPPKTLRMTHMS